MRYFVTFATLLAGALCVPTTLAQDGNAIPQIEVLSWVVDTNNGTTVIVFDQGAGIGSLNDVFNYKHFESDQVTTRVRITDGDWQVDDEGGGNNEAVYVRLRAAPLRGFGPPEPGPVTEATDEFQPEEGDGLEPPEGSTELFFNFRFTVPEFIGKNQQRLLGEIDFDCAWIVQLAVSNEQQPEQDEVVNEENFGDFIFLPCDPTVMSCVGVLVLAIENPLIENPNAPPFADAGADKSALVGSTIQLDASRSFDSFNIGFDVNDGNVLEQDTLTYTWEFVAGPVRVDPVQTSTLDPVALVTLDTLGTYVYRVTVDDNFNALPSQDTVTISVVESLPASNPPLAVIVGPASALPIGTIITLDGRQSSDPDGDTLKFRWTQTNSLGQALTSDDVFRAFQPLAGVDSDVSMWQAVSAGTFYFRLLVDDGDFISSARFQVRVIPTQTAGQTAENPSSNGSDGTSFGSDLSPVSPAACGAGLMPLAVVPAALWVSRRRRAL